MFSLHRISQLPSCVSSTGRHLHIEHFKAGWVEAVHLSVPKRWWGCEWCGTVKVCGGWVHSWSVQVGNLSSAMHPHSELVPLSQCVGFCVDSHCKSPGLATVVSGASLLKQRPRLWASTLPKQQTDWLTWCLTDRLGGWLTDWMADWVPDWLSDWLDGAEEWKYCVSGNL